jgi:hypothetical protein
LAAPAFFCAYLEANAVSPGRSASKHWKRLHLQSCPSITSYIAANTCTELHLHAFVELFACSLIALVR